MTTAKHWSIESALGQIRSCGFECEAGPLSNNVAWQWLEDATKCGPQFWPGQGVWFKVDAEAAGVKLSQWMHFYVVGCRMSSDTERRLWLYDLSYDPPGPSHYGTTQFTNVEAEKLSLVQPEQVPA